MQMSSGACWNCGEPKRKCGSHPVSKTSALNFPHRRRVPWHLPEGATAGFGSNRSGIERERFTTLRRDASNRDAAPVAASNSCSLPGLSFSSYSSGALIPYLILNPAARCFWGEGVPRTNPSLLAMSLPLTETVLHICSHRGRLFMRGCQIGQHPNPPWLPLTSSTVGTPRISLKASRNREAFAFVSTQRLVCRSANALLRSNEVRTSDLIVLTPLSACDSPAVVRDRVRSLC